MAGRPRKAKAKNIDRELDEFLGEIEKAWRAKGHGSLRGLVFKADEKGVIAESTWHGWRNGERSPDFLELRRVARSVGLDIGPRLQGTSSASVPDMSPEAFEVATYVNSIPEEDFRRELRDAVSRLIQVMRAARERRKA